MKHLLYKIGRHFPVEDIDGAYDYSFRLTRKGGSIVDDLHIGELETVGFVDIGEDMKLCKHDNGTYSVFCEIEKSTTKIDGELEVGGVVYKDITFTEAIDYVEEHRSKGSISESEAESLTVMLQDLEYRKPEVVESYCHQICQSALETFLDNL